MSKLTAAVAALLVAATAALGSLPAAAYSVSGRQIYDDAGRVIQLKGVNWFGFETTNHTVHGLWARNWKQMIQQMKDLGFNAVRLPLCPTTVRGITPTSIDYSLNPDLAGKNSLAVLDAVIAELDRQGLYVLLDHHRPDCQAVSELWYTPSYTEAQWLADLRFVANRYRNRPRVIGIDLKNEPHGAATWGSRNAATDWNQATGRAATQVLGAAPHWLIFVEGIGSQASCSSGEPVFWGENLAPIACTPSPVPANRLVLSPHTYGPDVHVQRYHEAANFPANMAAIWERHWGFAIPYAPVVLGEFGGKYGEGHPRDRAWQNALVDYLIGKRVSSGFYWSWNPNSGDTGGVLRDDWRTVRSDKMDLLRRFWAGRSSTGGTTGSTTGSGGGGSSGGGSGGHAGGGEAPTLGVTVQQTSDWGAGYCASVVVRNFGATAVDWQVELGIEGRLNQVWNAVVTQSGQRLQAQGVDWNRSVAAQASRDWGYCADR